MIVGYRHRSRIGTFHIRREQDWRGVRWTVYCQNERLGAYVTPHVAVEEVAGGSCDWPGVTNPADLNISDDISDWEAVRA
jgi:hypothetical protein